MPQFTCVLCHKPLGTMDIYLDHAAGIVCGNCIVEKNIRVLPLKEHAQDRVHYPDYALPAGCPYPKRDALIQ